MSHSTLKISCALAVVTCLSACNAFSESKLNAYVGDGSVETSFAAPAVDRGYRPTVYAADEAPAASAPHNAVDYGYRPMVYAPNDPAAAAQNTAPAPAPQYAAPAPRYANDHSYRPVVYAYEQPPHTVTGW